MPEEEPANLEGEWQIKVQITSEMTISTTPTMMSTMIMERLVTDESVFRELVFRGRSGFRGLRFLKRGFSRAKRIWI